MALPEERAPESFARVLACVESVDRYSLLRLADDYALQLRVTKSERDEAVHFLDTLLRDSTISDADLKGLLDRLACGWMLTSPFRAEAEASARRHIEAVRDAMAAWEQLMTSDALTIAGKAYASRLIIGTGKYKSYAENAAALHASGAEIVTVAVRRVNISDPTKERLTDHIDPKKVVFLPNTAGCFTADEALRTLRLAREAGDWKLVKLEVLADQKTLYPDMEETLRAAKILVAEGFDVMVYCSDDPVYARKLEDAGCVAIMPLGSLIGSGLGIQNPVNIRLIVEQTRVPVIVDAGVGTASDAAIAMELGVDGVLMNTAIAEAKDPIRMARAMKHAVIAGREAYLAGRMGKKKYADPSSPLGGLI